MSISDKPSTPVGPLIISNVTQVSADLEWKPPESDGGTPLKYYVIEIRESRRNTWGRVADVKPTHTKFTVPSLVVDNEYMFRVIAVNAEGQSPPLTCVDPATPRKEVCE